MAIEIKEGGTLIPNLTYNNQCKSIVASLTGRRSGKLGSVVIHLSIVNHIVMLRVHVDWTLLATVIR